MMGLRDLARPFFRGGDLPKRMQPAPRDSWRFLMAVLARFLLSLVLTGEDDNERPRLAFSSFWIGMRGGRILASRGRWAPFVSRPAILTKPSGLTRQCADPGVSLDLRSLFTLVLVSPWFMPLMDPAQGRDQALSWTKWSHQTCSAKVAGGRNRMEPGRGYLFWCSGVPSAVRTLAPLARTVGMGTNAALAKYILLRGWCRSGSYRVISTKLPPLCNAGLYGPSPS